MVALREAAEEKIKEAQSEVDYMKGEVAEAAQAVEAKDAELSDKIAETQVALRDAANSKTLHKKTEQGLSALKEECSATSAKLLGQASRPHTHADPEACLRSWLWHHWPTLSLVWCPGSTCPPPMAPSEYPRSQPDWAPTPGLKS